MIALNLFGIDALNDVYITEAGSGMGEELALPGSGIVDEATLKARFEVHVKAGRAKMTGCSLFADKQINRDAFFSVLMANDGRKFIPARALFYGDNRDILWPHTLGTIIEKNAAKLVNPTSEQAFRTEIERLLDGLQSGPVNSPAVVLTEDEVTSLHHMVEVLSLISD